MLEGEGREAGRSATINVTICDLCLAPAWLTLWYLEFLSERSILFAAEIAEHRHEEESDDADDDCI